MTNVITLRGPEPVHTCDENGHWFTETRTRIREGNGWREIKSEDEYGRRPIPKQEATK
jgi:hypothetical protein